LGESSERKPWPDPLDLGGVRSRSLGECRHIVHIEDFATAADPDGTAAAFLESLPRILGAERLRDLARDMVKARRDDRGVVLALGGHVAKVGVGPLVVDLMERGVVTAIAANGAFAIHDLEIALGGSTSEDVDEVLKDGTFGMARETADAFDSASRRASGEGTGLGRCLGEALAEAPHGASSVLASGARLRVPVTVHLAIGTDTVHMHPGISGAHLGESTLNDFRILASAARALGVWVNVGSAVILPEVFLKIVGVLRNLGEPMDDITAADLDFIRHYRPGVNVLRRPASKGIALTGHHEILLPLLRLAILMEGDR
jgi:hypothetical protein